MFIEQKPDFLCCVCLCLRCGKEFILWGLHPGGASAFLNCASYRSQSMPNMPFIFKYIIYRSLPKLNRQACTMHMYMYHTQYIELHTFISCKCIAPICYSCPQNIFAIVVYNSPKTRFSVVSALISVTSVHTNI